MEAIKKLSGFYEQIADDCRIGATHISLYMAFFECWNRNKFCGPVIFNSREIMEMAKIDSRATYHKCLKDLVEFGYVKYFASFNPVVKNKVYLDDDCKI